jgi:hypothetical protein
VLGPTATGKSALGIALARRFDGEVINCDSTAVYRGFDIGTDKVPEAERQGVPHHLVDLVEPTGHYTAADYGRDAAALAAAIQRRGRLPGGPRGFAGDVAARFAVDTTSELDTIDVRVRVMKKGGLDVWSERSKRSLTP